MQTDKEFEDFFKEQLNGLEETPPAGAWKKIAKDIKPRRTYYWQMAAVLLLLLFSAGVYLGVKKQPKASQETTFAATENKVAPSQNQPVASSVTENPATASVSGKKVENAPVTTAQPVEQITKTEIQSAPATRTSETVASSVGAGNNVASGRETRLNNPLAIARTKTRQPVKATERGFVNNSGSSETFETKAETSTKVTNTGGVIASGKQYGKTVKNSAPASATNPETAVAAGGKMNEAKASTLAANSPAKETALPTETGTKENALASKTSTIETTATKPEIALNQPARIDSIALNTIPEVPADQVKAVALEDEDKEKKERKRPAISLKFTPGIIARRLSANPDDDQYVRFVDNKQSKRPADLGFDVSATIHHRISPKTTLDGSFAFTRLRSNVNYSVSNGKIRVVSQSVTGDSSSEVKVEYIFADEEVRNELTYGSFRAGLTQELIKSGHNTFFVGGGAGLNMLLSKSGRIHSESQTVSGQVTLRSLGSKAFHNVNSHVYLNCGLAKEIMPQVSVLIAPAFTYYLSSVLTAQEAFKLKPYTIGLNFGLHYQF